MSDNTINLGDYFCIVCLEPIRSIPHTYHQEGCPARESNEAPCAQLSACGEDCHLGCCPTCQASGE